MNNKYPPLIGDCKYCELGCYKLEDINFVGRFYCPYFDRKDKERYEKKLQELQKSRRML